ncbi:translation elongation factor 4 [Holospora undulata]|uniref:Elongation factor 4 n=1 Tax=Holospora undulata HU1 TaxID=1321371 RepID=A0A061JGY6_9PROT|nr:translation elongation factor 4 [Holospora undulata]ETZ04527.1 elongation factor 4 [Holospora undulata HU1]
MHINKNFIRNFAIIAHIDHGKSTLADALMRICGALEQRHEKEQFLDNMDIERERGITIKAQTVRLKFKAQDGNVYQLNLMDTPGHVDFSYEVSRSLAACEGSLLVVDASQGVEAQTLANVYKAIENNHTLIPVLNKMDLPSADPENIKIQIQHLIGIPAEDAIEVSAKKGIGIEAVLQAIVDRLPCPQGDETACLKALLVDSWYDAYLGVILLVRIMDGIITPKKKIRMMAANAVYTVEQIGVFTPYPNPVEHLACGEVGYIIANVKAVGDCHIGDTITEENRPAEEALPGFKSCTPVVFCSLFPVEAGDFDKLKESLAKLHLNDASFSYEMDSSNALGFGFRLGLLGLLHLEVVQERLEREFDLDLIITAPSVIYKIQLQNGTWIDLHNPSDMPSPNEIKSMMEPWIKATLFVPDAYVGSILTLLVERRGIRESLEYVTPTRALMVYRMPLNEVAFDFYDTLKSLSRGHASFDYEMNGYEEGELVLLSIALNGDPIHALSFVVPKVRAYDKGRAICEKLKEILPRQLFPIAIQATVGGKILARETVSALRKNVTAKCYGGDITRKRKLLEKQKEGKKRMRQFGNIEIPQKAFIEVLKIGK